MREGGRERERERWAESDCQTVSFVLSAPRSSLLELTRYRGTGGGREGGGKGEKEGEREVDREGGREKVGGGQSVCRTVSFVLSAPRSPLLELTRYRDGRKGGRGEREGKGEREGEREGDRKGGREGERERWAEIVRQTVSFILSAPRSPLLALTRYRGGRGRREGGGSGGGEREMDREGGREKGGCMQRVSAGQSASSCQHQDRPS